MEYCQTLEVTSNKGRGKFEFTIQLYNESPWLRLSQYNGIGKGDTVTTTNGEARQLGATTPPVPTRKFIIH